MSAASQRPAARLRVTAEQMAALRPHLFPGDRDEHGAVLLAGIREDANGVRLLARELHLLICRVVCQVGVFDRVRWAGVFCGGREAGAPGSVSALPV